MKSLSYKSIILGFSYLLVMLTLSCIKDTTIDPYASYYGNYKFTAMYSSYHMEVSGDTTPPIIEYIVHDNYLYNTIGSIVKMEEQNKMKVIWGNDTVHCYNPSKSNYSNYIEVSVQDGILDFEDKNKFETSFIKTDSIVFYIGNDDHNEWKVVGIKY